MPAVKPGMVNMLLISRFAKPFYEAAVWFGEGRLYGMVGWTEKAGMASPHAESRSLST